MKRPDKLEKTSEKHLSYKVMYLSLDALNGIDYNSNGSLRECLKTLCTKRYKQASLKITQLQITLIYTFTYYQ